MGLEDSVMREGEEGTRERKERGVVRGAVRLHLLTLKAYTTLSHAFRGDPL